MQNSGDSKETVAEGTAKHFTGTKAQWEAPYEELLERIKRFGSDVTITPTNEYINVLRKDKQFAIVKVDDDRMEIGINLKNVSSSGRFKEAGTWNTIMTHRVQILTAEQLDEELISWLHQAYERIK